MSQWWVIYSITMLKNTIESHDLVTQCFSKYLLNYMAEVHQLACNSYYTTILPALKSLFFHFLWIMWDAKIEILKNFTYSHVTIIFCEHFFMCLIICVLNKKNKGRKHRKRTNRYIHYFRWSIHECFAFLTMTFFWVGTSIIHIRYNLQQQTCFHECCIVSTHLCYMLQIYF